MSWRQRSIPLHESEEFFRQSPLDESEEVSFDLSWRFHERGVAPGSTLLYLKNLQQLSEEEIGILLSADNVDRLSSNIRNSIISYYKTLWHVSDDSTVNIDLLKDGNLYGYWNARDYLTGKIKVPEFTASGKPLVFTLQAPVPPGTSPPVAQNYYTPVAFYSGATHYSFPKAAALAGVRGFSETGREMYPGECPITDGGSWPIDVPSDAFGTLNISKLAPLVEFFAAKGHPILVSLNCGGGSRGGYDDVKEIRAALLPIFENHGLLERHMPNGNRQGYWIHVDTSDYTAYLKEANAKGYTHRDGSPLEAGPDFSFTEIESMATQLPSGVYLSTTKYEHLGQPSITGKDMVPDVLIPKLKEAADLWVELSKGTVKDDIESSLNRLAMGGQLEKGIKDIGLNLGVDLWVERAPLGSSVLFRELNEDLRRKHRVGLETIAVGEEQRRYSIATVTRYVDKPKVDSLLRDIKMAGVDAFADASLKSGIATGKSSQPPAQHGTHGTQDFSHSGHVPHHGPWIPAYGRR